MKTVTTDSAPAAIGPYSQAKICGNLVFASGQIPADPSDGTIKCENITDQTEQVCKNVKALLEAAGTSMDKVVKTTCFLADIADPQSKDYPEKVRFLGFFHRLQKIISRFVPHTFQRGY